MDIRALTTVLGFRLDESGLKQYETAVTKIKGLAMEVGKMFGLYFAIDKIGEYAGEIVKAGREMGRLNAQIAMLARSGDNAQAATDALFATAQKLGLEYKDIAETYKGFLVDTQSSTISQEELLTATENVYKALRVGRNSAEEMGNAIQAIERGLRLGRFDRRSIGRIIETPGLQGLLLSASGAKDIDTLRALAKQGKITGEQMIEWLSKPNAQLQKDFEAMPKRIDWVFNQIKNSLASGTAELWKMSNGFSALGDVIWWTFSKATTAIKWTIATLGGLKSTLELVGIAMAVVLGPYMIRQAILMTAQFVEMAIASWAIWAPWIAIGVAIAAITLGIQDLMYWFQGKGSLIGSWVGPFDQFKKAFEDMPLVKLGTALNDFATGNWTAGITHFTEALKEPKKLMEEIVTLAEVAIPVAFLGWEFLKLTNFVGLMGGAKTAITDVATEAEKTATTMGTAGAKAGKSFVTGFGTALGELALVIALAMEAQEMQKQIDKIAKDMHERIKKSVFGGKEYLPDVLQPKTPEQRTEDVKKHGFWWNLMFGDPFGDWKPATPDKPGDQPAREPGSGKADGPVMGMTDMASLMQMLTYGAMPWDVGAMAKTAAAPQQDITLSVAPVINVTTPDEAALAALIQERVTTAGTNILEQASRQLQYATPRIEMPTQ